MLNNFSISERKVAIIGAGFVGASIAYALTIRKLAREIVLIDIHEEKTIGEALDIQHGIPDMGISSVKAGNYEDCKDCDLIIITAGRNRKPGETRLDLIAGNSAILKNVVDQMKPHYTKGVIMIVSNPVDVLVYQCTKWMGLPNGMVFGTGCILYSEMGATIIKGKGRTHYGIATCVCYLAEAVLNQRLTIAPVSTMFQGEYGIEDVCLSVPSIIGVNGVEKRLEERWAEEEFLAFRQAAEKMRNVLKTL